MIMCLVSATLEEEPYHKGTSMEFVTLVEIYWRPHKMLAIFYWDLTCARVYVCAFNDTTCKGARGATESRHKALRIEPEKEQAMS